MGTARSSWSSALMTTGLVSVAASLRLTPEHPRGRALAARTTRSRAILLGTAARCQKLLSQVDGRNDTRGRGVPTPRSSPLDLARDRGHVCRVHALRHRHRALARILQPEGAGWRQPPVAAARAAVWPADHIVRLTRRRVFPEPAAGGRRREDRRPHPQCPRRRLQLGELHAGRVLHRGGAALRAAQRPGRHPGGRILAAACDGAAGRRRNRRHPRHR